MIRDFFNCLYWISKEDLDLLQIKHGVSFALGTLIDFSCKLPKISPFY